MNSCTYIYTYLYIYHVPMCCLVQNAPFWPRQSLRLSAVSHSRHICWFTQETCLLRHAADMPAVSLIRQVCCPTQQTSQL